MKKSDHFNIKFIGGVKQIGSNMALVSYGETQVLIDAGILFAKDDVFNINYLIPDFDELEGLTDIVFTHGHEDHIGAVLHILAKFPQINIWASPFCAALIKRKLYFNNLTAEINLFQEASVLQFGKIIIHPIYVTHSIPETFGLYIKVPDLSLSCLYISDFKSDLIPIDGRPINLKKIKALDENENTKLLLADSTNILSSNKLTPSESEVYPVLLETIKAAPSRVFTTCFASNVARIQMFIDIARITKRKIVLAGLSMKGYIDAAKAVRLLSNVDNIIFDSNKSFAKNDKIIVLASGSQGDFRGAFRRIASGNDANFKPKADDLFILSSKTIPGNETKVSEILNLLAEQNVNVVTDRDKLVHVSGHPGISDLKILYDSYLPTDIIPIHGESLFLKKHFELIQTTFPQVTPHLVHNGDSVQISLQKKCKIIAGEIKDPELIIGKMIPIERKSISERRKIAEGGCIVLTIPTTHHKSSAAFKIKYIGLPKFLETDDEQNEKSIQFITDTIAQTSFNNITAAEENIRIDVRRFFQNIIGIRSVVVVHII